MTSVLSCQQRCVFRLLFRLKATFPDQAEAKNDDGSLMEPVFAAACGGKGTMKRVHAV